MSLNLMNLLPKPLNIFARAPKLPEKDDCLPSSIYLEILGGGEGGGVGEWRGGILSHMEFSVGCAN